MTTPWEGPAAGKERIARSIKEFNERAAAKRRAEAEVGNAEELRAQQRAAGEKVRADLAALRQSRKPSRRRLS